jgi:hypothetical protein
MAMTQKQFAEFAQNAEKRRADTVARLLRVPAIRDAVREPAPGQEAKTAKYTHTKIRVTVRCA